MDGLDSTSVGYPGPPGRHPDPTPWRRSAAPGGARRRSPAGALSAASAFAAARTAGPYRSSACRPFEQVKDDPVPTPTPPAPSTSNPTPATPAASSRATAGATSGSTRRPFPSPPRNWTRFTRAPTPAARTAYGEADSRLGDDPLFGQTSCAAVSAVAPSAHHRARGRIIQSRRRNPSCGNRGNARQAPRASPALFDLGGPTANMYHMEVQGREDRVGSAAACPASIPDICENLAPTTAAG